MWSSWDTRRRLLPRDALDERLESLVLVQGEAVVGGVGAEDLLAGVLHLAARPRVVAVLAHVVVRALRTVTARSEGRVRSRHAIG